MAPRAESYSNNQIREYRKKRGQTLKQTARILGIRNENHINEWETGVRVPTLENAMKLSAALNCPVEVLFFERFRELRAEARERQARIKSFSDSYPQT